MRRKLSMSMTSAWPWVVAGGLCALVALLSRDTDRIVPPQALGLVVPVDGTLSSETAFVDTSALTGESLPVRLAHCAVASKVAGCSSSQATMLPPAGAALAAVPPDRPLIVDGFVFGSLSPEALAAIAAPVVGMVHHPLALEEGLTAERRRYLFETERANLRRADAVLVPSPHTRRMLVSEYGADPERITVARPGTDRPTGVRAPSDPPLVLSVGIQPDILVCRTDRSLPENERRKIALFTNVHDRSVIAAQDVDDIYKMPSLLQRQHLDDLVITHFGMEAPEADLSNWAALVDARIGQDATVRVAMVGKYVDLADAYKSVNEALSHAGLHTATRVDIDYVDSESVARDPERALSDVDAILVPGGFGERGIEGKIAAARFARTHGVPYFGICLGMQVACIDYARDVAGLTGAHSTEFAPDAVDPVIALVTEWMDAGGMRQIRDENADLGGTMRLGEQRCIVAADTLAHRCYGADEIHERHRHRYEFNNHYRDRLAEAGLTFSGYSADDDLVEIVEISDHPWFLGCQFHPEFTSTPRAGHPLFMGFIAAARAYSEARAD